MRLATTPAPGMSMVMSFVTAAETTESMTQASISCISRACWSSPLSFMSLYTASGPSSNSIWKYMSTIGRQDGARRREAHP
ncbi:MAG: hypothetical protein AAF570_01535, partial [Bacteroidota bacterium]